jgi:hypothetical protein
LFPWLLAYPVSEYAAGAANCCRGHLLLPLRGVARASQLRENVRNAEERFAALGKDLRKAKV